MARQPRKVTNDNRSLIVQDGPKASPLHTPRGPAIPRNPNGMTFKALPPQGNTSITRRESARPLGEGFADIQALVADAVAGGATITAGTGLTDTSGTFSVNSSLTHVTEVGTLTTLNVSGAAGFAGHATFSGTISVPAPIVGGNAVTKTYADQYATVAGTGLTKTGDTFSVNASQPQIIAVGTLTSLDVSGASTFGGAVTVPTPTLAGHAATMGYVDSTVVNDGDGLTKTGNLLSVNAYQPQITAVGTLTGLTVDGAVITPMQYSVPTEGGNVSALTNTTGLILNPAGTLNALTVVFPNPPVNGQRFSVHTTADIIALTVTATFAPGHSPPPGLTAETPLRYIYSGDLSAWIIL